MRTRFSILSGALGLWSVLFSGCQVVRYVPQGMYLLESQPTFRGNKSFSASVLSEQISLQPNTRILGLRVPLHLYNWGRYIGESRLVQKRIPKLSYYGRSAAYFLQARIGEPPVIIRRKTLEEDALTLERFYRLEGYLGAKVQPIVRPLPLFPKRASVIYGIFEGLPWHVEEITFRLQDSLLQSWAERIRPFLPIQVGMRLRAEDLERTRRFIYDQLQESGYPAANLGDIYFEVDTFQWVAQVDSVMSFFFNIKTRKQKKNYHPCKVEIFLEGYYTPYAVEKVEVHMHVADEARDQKEIRTFPLRVTGQKSTTPTPIIVESSMQARAILHPDVLGKRVAMIVGKTYARQNISYTQRLIGQLPAVRSVQAQPVLDSLGQLGIVYDVQLRPPIAVQVGVEGFQIADRFFNTSLPGFNLALTFRQQSLFARGLNFFVRGIGGVSYYRVSPTAPVVPLYNIQLQSALQVPPSRSLLSTSQLLNPKFIRHQIRANYQSLRRIEFDRSFLSCDIQKLIQNPDATSEMTVSWFSLIYVQSRLSASFSERIARLPLNIQGLILRDFFPRLYVVNGVRYTTSLDYFTRQAQGWYASFQFDTNIPYTLVERELRRQDVRFVRPSGVDTVIAWTRVAMDVRYALRNKVGGGLYARLFLGQAAPVRPDSNIFVPYEIRFFAGGPNSMRGWQIGGLGTTDSVLSGSLFAFGAERIMEVNLELRQRVYKFFHVALFTDVGFVENRAPSKAAVAGGIGIRLDWGFSVIRLDIGQQLYRPDWRQWLFPPKKYWGGAFAQYHIAIGYPF
ncbi:MAG: BamA/TamA family outer membrane protein [Bacteroidia bacterium]